ncbi:DUF192 domain-containing protein [Rubrivirga sp. S365]|uniref:DUF192 domain-containing protein n=1 Tax=Rubrivirga sp. S365 TaxID=3076080 RepID=UPI0028C9B0E9|nr:DUF192 domain-containing protein [Rubrivirga sp. S365]MDT7857252.1 DUF192 domain-containing protein [Rubrivirga sp. S365]
MRRSATLTALAALAVAAPLAGCAQEDEPTAPPVARPSIPFEVEGRLSFVRGADTLRTIDVEIADTDSTRQRGLMERTEIPPETGMLFVFPGAQQQAFYMANTPRSLDIQFYGPDSTLLNIAHGTTPYSTDNVLSDGAAQFVVEVPAGYSRRLGLVEGDRITWSAGGAE